MTDSEELEALRRIMVKKPKIRLSTAMREIHERDAIWAMKLRLDAESGVHLAGERMIAMAGSTEGLL